MVALIMMIHNTCFQTGIFHWQTPFPRLFVYIHCTQQHYGRNATGEETHAILAQIVLQY